MRHAGCELLRGAGRLGLGRGNWACEVLLQDSAGFSLEAIFGKHFAEDLRHKRNGTWFWQTFPIIVQVVLPLFFFCEVLPVQEEWRCGHTTASLCLCTSSETPGTAGNVTWCCFSIELHHGQQCEKTVFVFCLEINYNIVIVCYSIHHMTLYLLRLA